MDQTGQILQGGQPSTSTQLPSLTDHANNLMGMAQKMPPGDPNRQQLILNSLQMADTHAQSQPPPDGLILDAPDGHSYRFNDQASYQKAQEWVQQQQQNMTGGGVVNNVLGGVKNLVKPVANIGNQIMDVPGAGANLATGEATPEQAMQQIQTPHTVPFLGELSGVDVQHPFAQGYQEGTAAGTLATLPGAASAAVDLGGSGIDALTSAIGFANKGDEAAINTAFDTINQATAKYTNIGKTLQSDIEGVTVANPEATISMQGQGELLQRISEVPHGNFNFDPNNITPTDVQKVSTELQRLANSSSEKVAGDITGLKDDFRSWAQKTFSQEHPEVAQQIEDSFAKASQSYKNMETVSDIFPNIKNPSAKDATALLDYIQKQSADPQGQLAMQKTIQDYFKSEGIDLSSNVKAMSYINKLPGYKKAIMKEVLRYIVPAGIAGEIIKNH
jgi:hypothetical protein